MGYTDYVIPSGAGTRIVIYSAPLFMSETGEPAPGEVLDQMFEPLRGNYVASLQRLAENGGRRGSQLGNGLGDCRISRWVSAIPASE